MSRKDFTQVVRIAGSLPAVQRIHWKSPTPIQESCHAVDTCTNKQIVICYCAEFLRLVK